MRGDYLSHLLERADLGPGVLIAGLAVAFVLGAIHALSPGHGKTIVAAYLVGSRGTPRHAIFLGGMVTFTHTISVFALGFATLFLSRYVLPEKIFPVLGVISGLMIVWVGTTLFFKRLHVARHHHRAHHHHDHHHHGHDHAPSPSRPLTWMGLIVMGMTGGIAPCWDAVAMLVLAIGMNLLWLALPMLLAFSAGLAAVLVVIGILVVHARKLLDTRWSNSRVVRLLPIASALFITGMGVLVCFQGVQH